MIRGAHQATSFNQTPNTDTLTSGVRLRGITFVVKRETTQIAG
jgi:hypothetical protein